MLYAIFHITYKDLSYNNNKSINLSPKNTKNPIQTSITKDTHLLTKVSANIIIAWEKGIDNSNWRAINATNT